MALKDELMGARVVVVGSGPSLEDPAVLDEIRARQAAGARVFATKAAIKWLLDHDIRAEYGISMDPGAHIAVPEKIWKSPGIVHIIASSSDPALFDYLLADDQWGPATVRVFHSACGAPDEQQLYAELFPESAVMGGGFNVVNRAVALAMWMGASHITLAGTDCGWREGQHFYVGGLKHRPGVDMCDGGKVDGRPWWTRPDMLASGVALARLARKHGPERFDILGDVLPAALLNKDEGFLREVADFG
jgi:hypothetical protein